MERGVGKGGSFGFKKGFIALIFMLEVILVFAFFDYLAHGISPDYAVQPAYFIKEIIYVTLIGFVAYLLVRKQPALRKSLILAVVISMLLEIVFYLQDYLPNFIWLFLAVHFAILFVVSYLGIKLVKM